MNLGERHISSENFDRYLDSQLPVMIPVRGTPEVFLFIEPFRSELGLRIVVGMHMIAPETGLRNVVARVIMRDGNCYFLEVVVTVPTLFRDAYPMLCAMADRVQLDGMPPVQALRATLDRLKTLLTAPESLTREREVGLFGELLVLGGLIQALGPLAAVQAWRGSESEEHDFGLSTLDLEVKTTTSEHRAHWIESITQLVPTLNRPLWLVSHQITMAGTGHGRALHALIDTLRATIGMGSDRDGFETALSHSGWREEERERLVTRWTRRTESLAYHVTTSFPRLTPDALRQHGVSLHRIVDVRYRIDLDGLADQPTAPDPIGTALRY